MGRLGDGDYHAGAATTFPSEAAGTTDWFHLKFKAENTPSTPTIGGVVA